MAGRSRPAPAAPIHRPLSTIARPRKRPTVGLDDAGTLSRGAAAQRDDPRLALQVRTRSAPDPTSTFIARPVVHALPPQVAILAGGGPPALLLSGPWTSTDAQLRSSPGGRAPGAARTTTCSQADRTTSCDPRRGRAPGAALGERRPHGQVDDVAILAGGGPPALRDIPHRVLERQVVAILAGGGPPALPAFRRPIQEPTGMLRSSPGAGPRRCGS
ncbi:hypothetical protein FAGKG844_830007 [Frankia sp. AgKG'84/4]